MSGYQQRILLSRAVLRGCGSRPGGKRYLLGRSQLMHIPDLSHAIPSRHLLADGGLNISYNNQFANPKSWVPTCTFRVQSPNPLYQRSLPLPGAVSKHCSGEGLGYFCRVRGQVSGGTGHTGYVSW